VIERHRRRLKRPVKRITVDLDATDDPTHRAIQKDNPRFLITNLKTPPQKLY
jgi:hypothetical protein